ncbi:hypothetical protein OIE75_41160 (plasmid) [Streptomyces sp. NBC_01723]|uniref:hypothetical protein n=1 Tax=Streptomyces sp. NBC_01723 TaxID=2975921 RepID=UPI002E306E41|nr:hypothetical protein [Streptomyces sp. NBC_01723]
MAISTLSPETCDSATLEDPVTLKDAQLLFGDAGIDLSRGTFTRWVKQDRLDRKFRGREMMVSFSDLLESYTRRYPVPGRPVD